MSSLRHKRKRRAEVEFLTFRNPWTTQFTCVPRKKKAIFVFLSIVAVFNNMVLFALFVEYVSKYVTTLQIRVS